MKHQIKRFNQFVNEYYSHSDFFGKEEGGAMSACCGSDIDDDGCCTECGEYCETTGEMPEEPAMHHSRHHMGHDWETAGQHGEWRIEEGKRKPKAEDMEMEDDEMPMAKKPAAKAPAKKPMPFAPKKPAGKAKKEEMEDDEMPMAKKAPAKKPMPFMPKKPAGKAPMIQPKKPGAAGVDLIKGAAAANAMKKSQKGGMM